MRRHVWLVAASLASCVCLGAFTPASATAAPPVTTLSLSGGAGPTGWWTPAPEVRAAVDRDATLHFDWGEGESTRLLAGGAPPVGICFAAEGIATVHAWAENAEGTGPTVSLTIKTDSVGPSGPEPVAIAFATGGVSLSWPASVDPSPGSGIAGYRVYRNLTGPPFSGGDEIGFTTSPAYVDPDGYGPCSYAVCAIDVAGNASLLSETATTPADVTSPTAPADLAAWRNAAASIRVSWSPSTDEGSGIAGYVVSRVVDGGPASEFPPLPATATSLEDGDASAYAAAEVTYTVTARDRMGNVMAASTTPRTDVVGPAAPSSLTRALAPGGMQLTWDASSDPTSGVDGYRVYRNLTGPPFGIADRIAYVRDAGYLDLDAFLGVFHFSVSAVDRAGNESGLSDEVIGWLDTTPPSKPAALEAWRSAAPPIVLSWLPSTDAESGLDRYVVTRSIGGAPGVAIASPGKEATSFEDADASAFAAAEVTYEVAAVDRAGNPATESVSVSSDLEGPSAPAGLDANATSGGLALTWEASTDALSGLAGYRVYRNLTGPPFAEGDRIATVTVTSYLDAGAAGSVRHYAVDAFDRVGNASALSAQVLGDTEPPALAGVRAWRRGDRTVRLSWSAATDAVSGLDSYVLSRSLDDAPAVAIATLAAGATHYLDADPAVVGASSVAYTLTARDRAGNGAGVDVIPIDDATPPAVTPPVVRAIGETPARPGVLGSDVGVRCAVATDAVSGLARYELRYGPDPASPAFTAVLSGAADIVVPMAPDAAQWYFRVYAEDVAGNVATSAAVGLHVATADRAAGPNRLLTSVAVSKADFASSHAVVFANAWNFPDALAASGLAGALRAPILLVGPGPLPAETLAELRRLGAADAWVVGGPPAVSVATYDSIRRAVSGDTTRVAGADRYATAEAVARTVVALAGKPARVYVASGENFPDALSAGPAAYTAGAPILFARATSLPAVTSRALADAGAPQTVILGSAAAVWSGVEGGVHGPVRVAGPTRYGTSVAFAEWAMRQGILTAARPLLATGVNFPDGLSAAPFAGERRSPLLLVPGPLGEAGGFLDAHASEVLRVTAVGSEAVVPAPTLRSAWERVQVPSTLP